MNDSLDPRGVRLQKPLVSILLSLSSLTLPTLSSQAETDPSAALPVGFIAAGDSVLLDSAWRYHAGDDANWADPSFDDREWLMAGTHSLDSVPAGWPGIGWFRLHLRVDSLLWNIPVGLLCEQSGASEIYLDGRLVHTYGRVGRPEEREEVHLSAALLAHPVALVFSPQVAHVLAVRYSNFRPNEAILKYYPDGFRMQLRDYESSHESVSARLAASSQHQMLFTGLSLAFFMLHLMLYLFYPRLKANLCYALFTASIVGLTYCPPQIAVSHSVAGAIFYFICMSISVIAASVLGLWFLYSLFHERVPPHFWALTAVGVLLAIGSYYVLRDVIYTFSLLCLAEAVRVVILAIVRRKRGSWIIGIGYLLFITACAYQMLRDIGVLGYLIEDFYFEYMYGILALLLSMSVYLARQFSRINKDLGAQLVQVKELSARTVAQEREAKEQEVARKLLEQEVEHKQKELEEAKKLEKALNDLERANMHLRETQSQLVHSEKMAAMGMLVAGVAHDINTPIGAIGSMHNTLVRAIDKLKRAIASGSAGDDSIQRGLAKSLAVIDDANKVIESGVDRVTNIVRRLRSFARLDEAELVTANINECLEDTLTLAHHELKTNIEVIREFGDIPDIACFAGQLNQVFLNLIINAKQAIEGKGWIRIETFVRDGVVFVEISDSGSGIPQENLDRIFDPGFTTKGVKVGTGLGLSICYQIVQSHRGEIRVRSKVGEGTTFTIRLPMDLDKILEDS